MYHSAFICWVFEFLETIRAEKHLLRVFPMHLLSSLFWSSGYVLTWKRTNVMERNVTTRSGSWLLCGWHSRDRALSMCAAAHASCPVPARVESSTSSRWLRSNKADFIRLSAENSSEELFLYSYNFNIWEQAVPFSRYQKWSLSFFLLGAILASKIFYFLRHCSVPLT